MNARKLMINVVFFKFSILGSALFVMNIESMKEVKKVAGQPWSAWKKILQDKKFWELGIDEKTKLNNSSKNSVCCMKLPRSDMPLFGLCPKTEIFELVVCNYCGKKYKLSAFAEHIRVHHSDDNVASPKSVNSLIRIDKGLLKKGKIKKAEEKVTKAKETEDSPQKPQISHENKIDFMEIVSDKEPMLLESENIKKLKQINLKIKKNNKNSKNENITEEKLSEKANTCPLIRGTINEICCNSSNSNSLRPQLNVEGSTALKEGELRNLQPVVQMTPLLSIDTTSESSQVIRFISSDIKRMIEIQSNSIKNENTCSSDFQCEAVDKDNSKVCIQSTNNSVHISSKRAVVCGKNKNVEAVVDINNEGDKLPLIEVCTNCNSEKNRSPISLTAGKLTKSHVLVNHKINKTEGVKVDQKLVKRITSDKPRLSLPVSIKNPTITNSILSQLQNKVIKSKFSSSIESNKNDKNQEVVKENFVHKQIRNTRLNRSKENSGAQKRILKNGEPDTSESKDSLNKIEGLSMWTPGFRRLGGLLYANHNLPRICGTLKNFKNSISLLRKEEQSCSTTQSGLSNCNKLIDLVVDHGAANLSKKLSDTGCTAKRTALHNKQKGPILISSPKKNSYLQHKIINSQAQSNNKAIICKRLNSNTNGDVPSKIRKQDGIINIANSVLTKNEYKLPLMHVEVTNSLFENQVIATNQHVVSTNTIDLNPATPVPTGVEVISGNFIRSGSLRIGAPRIHYFTSSGPLPAASNTTNIQQLQLKEIRLPQKYQLLAPQISISPSSGVYFLQKATTNCSNLNGIEEK